MTRGIEAFPLVFTQIVESLADTEEPFTHKCASNKEAQALRFKFYSFIKAVKRGFSPREKELAEILSGLTFLIQGDMLVIERKDNLPEAQGLQASLSLFTNQNGVTPADRPKYLPADGPENPQTDYHSPGVPPAASKSPGASKSPFLLPKGMIEEIESVEDLVEDWFKGEGG